MTLKSVNNELTVENLDSDSDLIKPNLCSIEVQFKIDFYKSPNLTYPLKTDNNKIESQ